MDLRDATPADDGGPQLSWADRVATAEQLFSDVGRFGTPSDAHGRTESKSKRTSLFRFPADAKFSDVDAAAAARDYSVRPTCEYSTVRYIKGPLILVGSVKRPKSGEVVSITLKDGEKRRGQVLEASGRQAVVQVFEGTFGMDTAATRCEFTGDLLRLPVSEEMLGRTFDGSGRPVDRRDLPVLAEDYRDIHGQPINPCKRVYLKQMVQTGISAIDVQLSLARGQKLPLFSCSGLPHNELAAQLCRQASLVKKSSVIDESDENFCVVFAGMGVSMSTARFFKTDFEQSGRMQDVSLFLNLASDPAVERLITPRLALTAAEYLAFEREMHVLVILTDMTAYGDALREMAGERGESPGPRGYPEMMFSDLATIYERCGCVEGRTGSITQIPIVTMPNDDYTHPIPDRTGYLCEGHIFLDRELHSKGIYPPIHSLYSHSRQMPSAVGYGMTRVDHFQVARQMTALCVASKEAQGQKLSMGEDALSLRQKRELGFEAAFESKVLSQDPYEKRSVTASLDLCWDVLEQFPQSDLGYISDDMLYNFYPRERRARFERTGHMLQAPR